MIDTREATTQGGLGVTIEGPSEAPINCKDNGNGTCAVAYYPKDVGDYNVNVTYNNKHIQGSPFKASIGPEEPGIVPQQAPAAVASAAPAVTPGSKAPGTDKPGSPPKGKAAPDIEPAITPAAAPAPVAAAPGSAVPPTREAVKSVDVGKVKVSGNGIQPQGERKSIFRAVV